MASGTSLRMRARAELRNRRVLRRRGSAEARGRQAIRATHTFCAQAWLHASGDPARSMHAYSMQAKGKNRREAAAWALAPTHKRVAAKWCIKIN